MPFVNTSDIDMHYETGGRGKSVLVFVHGNFASWRWWQPVLKDLSGGYRAYAPDMRGCGDSDRPTDGYTIAQHADDLDHFIRALELPRLHLVGHSLGGCVAMEYALSRPNHLKTLTLVAPAPAEGQTVLKSTGAGNAFWGSSNAVERAYRWLGVLGIDRKVLGRVLKQMAPTLVDGMRFESLVDDAIRMSHNAAAGHLKSLQEWDVRSELADLDLPVLIVGGQNDELIPAEALQRTAANLPNGRLILWPRVGHTPQLERPERFIRILMKFIEQHSADSLKQFRKGFCRVWSRCIKNSC